MCKGLFKEEISPNDMSEEQDTLQTRSHSYSKTDKMVQPKSSHKMDLDKDKSSKESLEENVKHEMKKPTNENNWWDLFQKIGGALVGVYHKLKELKNTKGTVSSLSETFPMPWKKNIDDKIQVLELCDSDKDLRLNILSNMVIRQQEKIESLESKIEFLASKEARYNMIISGLLEERNKSFKSLCEKVAVFFKETMEIEKTTPVADVFRRGKRGARDRVVVVKLMHFCDKAVIFSHASNLKGKKNSRRRLFFVNDDASEQQIEDKKYFNNLRRENNDLKTKGKQPESREVK